MFDIVFWGNSLGNYFWFLFFILVGYFASWLLIFLSKNFFIKISKHTKNRIDNIFAKILSRPLPFRLIILTIFFNIGFRYLTVSDWWTNFVSNVSLLLYILGATLFIIRFLTGLIDEYLVDHIESTSKFDDQLIPLMKTLINIFCFAIAVLLVLSNLGYNISALLAGLGIGGLAIAMASKDIVENFLSGIVIFVEKPFKSGDVLKTSDGLGSVEEIGIRSTRIRTFDNTIVVVPNKHMSSNAVENISKRRARREFFTIGVVYSTSVTKIEKAKKIILNILSKNKSVERDTFKVSFESFGDFSLNLRVMYWITEANYFDFLDVKDKINSTIKKEFEKEKIEFAFPTQTIELKK